MKPDNIFYLGITLSSLDSLPLFSGVSMYAPYVAVGCFGIYYLYSIKKDITLKFHRLQLAILLFIIVSIFYSLVLGATKYSDFHGFSNFFIQIVIAILLYKTFNLYFRSLNPETYINTFSRSFILFSLPVIYIGIIEILIFPFKDIFSSLMSFISWRHTIDRIQLVSGEPAWASRFILCFLSVLPLSDISNKKKFHLILISFLLLIFIGSTLGIVCISVYYIFTYIKKKYLKSYIVALFLVLSILPILKNFLSDYTKARIELLSQLSSNDLESLAVSSGSGSVMARLGNPVLALKMGMDSPVLGIGGGYYYMKHSEYLNKIFPNACSINNINETGTTPKNLFARVFAELGIIGVLIVIFALVWIYKHKVYNNFLRGIFVSLILLTLNFDSLFHIYPLLLFCFLQNLPPKKLLLMYEK